VSFPPIASNRIADETNLQVRPFNERENIRIAARAHNGVEFIPENGGEAGVRLRKGNR